MNKLDEIKAFIQKNVAVMAEFEQLAQHDSLYSSYLSDKIIEQQQELRRHARRIDVIAVGKPFLEKAEFKVLITFDTFCSFINLEECKETVRVSEDNTHYHYSIIMDDIVLTAVKAVSNEEHKKAQAI